MKDQIRIGPKAGNGKATGEAYLKPIEAKTTSNAPILWFREDEVIGSQTDVVTEFLSSCSLAGAACLWGFNRVGGVTITLMIGGARQQYPFEDGPALFLGLSELTEMLIDYVKNELPNRLKAAERAGKL